MLIINDENESEDVHIKTKHSGKYYSDERFAIKINNDKYVIIYRSGEVFFNGKKIGNWKNN